MRDNTLVPDWFDDYDSLVEPRREPGFDRSAGIACWEGVEGVDQMIFRLRGKDVSGRYAIEVVRWSETTANIVTVEGQFVSTFFGLLID